MVRAPSRAPVSVRELAWLMLRVVLTSSGRRSSGSRTCRPRRSRGLWPGSSRRRPRRRHRSGAAPTGSVPPPTTRTAVAAGEGGKIWWIEEEKKRHACRFKRRKWRWEKTMNLCICDLWQVNPERKESLLKLMPVHHRRHHLGEYWAPLLDYCHRFMIRC